MNRKVAKQQDNRHWRTNVGLRLTNNLGAWFEQQCRSENRSFANYVETLIIREHERLSAEGKK